MREFILIFKLRLKANRKRAKNKRTLLNTGRKGIKLSMLGRVLLILIAFAPMMTLTWMSMSKTYPLVAQVPLSGGTLADAMLSNYLMFGGIMFIIGFFPILVYNIAANDKELEFLLTLPVSRTTLFFTILAQIALFAIYPLLIILPSIFSYIAALQNNLLGYTFATLVCIEEILFSLGISGLVALTIARSMKRKTASKLTMIVSLVNILMIVLFANLVPSSKSSSMEAFKITMQKFQNISLSKFNPFYWMAMAVKGNFAYLGLVTLVTIVVVYLIFLISKRLEFENTEKRSKRKKISYVGKTKPVIYTMIFKELKLLFREDQSIFMLLYPIAFPLIFGFIGSFQGFSAIYISVMLAVTYCAMATYGSFGFEKQISPYQLTFPIDKSLILTSKTVAPTILYSLDVLTVGLLFIFVFKTPPKLLLMVPFSIVMLFEVSLWAAKNALNNLQSFKSYREATRVGSLKINLFSMLMAQEILVPFIFITYPKILGKFSWLTPWLYVVMVVLLLLNAKFLFKNIDTACEKFEEI